MDKGKSLKKGKIIAAVCVCIVLAAAVIITVNIVNSRPKIVGKNIAHEEINEFYYTISTLKEPPYFLRYHFYNDEGKHMYTYEYREGETRDDLPLTEEDITEQITVELTDQQWSELMNLIDGGEAMKRGTDTSTGGDGPWTYIYWNGDKSLYQEYYFENRDKLSAFEDFCKELKEDN